MPNPRYLSRQQAADYLGVSVRRFEIEVLKGWWPAGLQRGEKGGPLTWDVKALDAAADRRSGLIPPAAPGGDLDAAEQQALELARRGTTPPIRPQHCHPSAA